MKAPTQIRTDETPTTALEAYRGYEVTLSDETVASLPSEATQTRVSRLEALRHLDGAQVALLATVALLVALFAFVVPPAITGFVLSFAVVVSLLVVVPYVVLSVVE